MDDLILDNDHLPEIKLYEADRIKRFINFCLDYILYNISAAVVLFMIGFSLGLFNLFPRNINPYYIYLFYVVWYFLFYFLQEHYLKGRTVAKFITQTKAVTTEGLPLTPKHAALRSLGRIIPFEGLSYLFADRGLHDQISNTKVVDWPKEMP